MPAVSAFTAAQHYRPCETRLVADVPVAARFGAPAAEYGAARQQAVLFDRADRGLVIVTGADRKSWLHNLVSNAVKTLDDGAGNYAFALDVRGRVQFDLNILCRPTALWLDLSRAVLPAARAHLERYLITEDVQLEDASDAWARLAISGPSAGGLAQQLGVGNAAALPSLASVEFEAEHVLVRHDLAGAAGFELFVPAAAAAGWWDRLAGGGAVPAGLDTLDVLRIEAGIPWLGRDIDEKVIAPETGQVERAISYHKGCYLGQEVIERMRSHGSQARRLVRLRMGPGPLFPLPAELQQDGQAAGRITSLALHPLDEARIGLGYLKSALRDASRITVGAPPAPVQIV